ncbi:MAG: tetratricopeptide repeat protein [Planctomycetes bacterium]|nr:tetratricopeptide repeat protein [Planctomycetota bacterium]
MNPESTATELVKEGLERARQGDSTVALELFGRALQADPTSIGALCNRGVVLYNVRRYDEALRDFEQALVLSPGLKMAVDGLARVRRKIEGPPTSAGGGASPAASPPVQAPRPPRVPPTHAASTAGPRPAPLTTPMDALPFRSGDTRKLTRESIAGAAGAGTGPGASAGAAPPAARPASSSPPPPPAKPSMRSSQAVPRLGPPAPAVTPSPAAAQPRPAAPEAVPATPFPTAPSTPPSSSAPETGEPVRPGLWRMGEILVGEVSEYEVRGLLGEGGMGSVYEVQDRRLETIVALKVPLARSRISAEGRARFLREVETWMEMGEHPNIVAARNADQVRGLLCIAAEFVNGTSLVQVIRERRLGNIATLIDLGIQFCEGMSHAHTLGVVHRDLKPGNALVSKDGILKVTDFGLVKVNLLQEVVVDVEEEDEEEDDAEASARPVDMSQTGRIVGSPPYMAPEQFESSRDVGPGADIYSFGCTFYAMACARPPFVDRNKYGSDAFTSFRLQHERDKPIDPRRLNPQVPARLAEVILGCLQKDPAARPESFDLVRESLTSIYADVAGRPYPRPRARPEAPGADYFRRRGRSYQFTGRVEKAKEDLDRALELDPGDIRAYRARSIVRQQLGDAKGAREDIDKAIELNPRYAEAYLQRAVLREGEAAGRLAGADYDRSIELNMHSLEAWLARAAFHKNRRNLQMALEDYDAAVTHWAQEPKAAYLRGIAREADGRIAAALDDYIRAMAMDAGYVDLWYEREGPASSRTTLLKKKILEEAIRRAPGDARLYFHRARYREAKGLALLALQDYRKAMELDPAYAQAFEERWRGYREQDERRLSTELARLAPAALAAVEQPAADLLDPPSDGSTARRALEQAERTVGKSPNSAGAYLVRGRAKEAAEDIPGALADYDRALELEPKLSEAYRLRASVRCLLGNEAGAREDYAAALRTNPRNTHALRDRAVVLAERGEGEAALKDLDRALELEPRNSSLYRRRGQLRGMEGDPQGAREDRDQADRLDGKEPQEE